MDVRDSDRLTMKRNMVGTKNKATREKYRIILIGVLVTISLALSLFTLLFQMFYMSIQEEENKSTQYCLLCSTVKALSHNDTDATHLYNVLAAHADKLKDGNKKCCARNQDEISALIRMQSKALTSKSTAKATTGYHLSRKGSDSSLAFAQKPLQLHPERVQDVESNQMYTLNIDPDSKESVYEMSKGVQLTKDGIKIVHPGRYFVYKSVNFVPDTADPCKKLPNMTFISELLRNKEVLMRSEHTCCPDCVYNSETGFCGGVFKLKSNDMIQVAVSGKKIVHVDRDVTYVGLMMMEVDQE